MFRLVALVCLIQLSVGNIIRGRVLLDGDASQGDPIPADSQLFLRLERISEAGSSEMILDELKISSLTTFPIEYQIRIPTNAPSAVFYKLSARIRKSSYFLYVGEETIHVTTGSESPIIVDIPVRVVRGRRALEPWLNNIKQLSWPELVGREGTYAVQYIKERTGLTNVVIVSEDSLVTADYRTDRVRVFVNKKGVVNRIPHTG